MLNIHVTYNETKKLTSCQKGIRFLEFLDRFFRKHQWIITFSWKLWNLLFKRRKTAELYIEIFIVQANFFHCFLLYYNFFGSSLIKKGTYEIVSQLKGDDSVKKNDNTRKIIFKWLLIIKYEEVL